MKLSQKLHFCANKYLLVPSYHWIMTRILLTKSSSRCLGKICKHSWQEHSKCLLKSLNIKKIAVLRRIKFLPSPILQTIYFKTLKRLVWNNCMGFPLTCINGDTCASFEAYKIPKKTNVDQLKKRNGWNNISLHYTNRLFKGKPTNPIMDLI